MLALEEIDHDLRRSFASRWAVKVLPQVLQKLMRHSNITTTMNYYAELDADLIADQLYLEPNRDHNRDQEQKSRSSQRGQK